MLELLGYLGLLLMGITLGLVGAGGAIFTLPILTYLLKVPVLLATTYSLVIVGSSAFLGAARRRHQILLRKALLFACPSALGVFVARAYILSRLPHTIGPFSKDRVLLFLLMLLMLFTAHFMMRATRPPTRGNFKPWGTIVAVALGAGVLIGILGIGGGFLMIPTLVLWMGFGTSEAISTSLCMIAINSCVGFFSDPHHLNISDWISLSKYLSFSLIGMLMGIFLSQFVKENLVKKILGGTIYLLAVFMLSKEFILATS